MAPVAELGLAPFVLEALGLRLTRAEALGLVTRLGLLQQHTQQMQADRAEHARAEAGPINAR